MSRLRPPDVGDRRHDPASLQAAAADLVLGGAPVGNPLQRYVGTAAVGPAWRHLQDRLASGAEASPRDDRSGSFRLALFAPNARAGAHARESRRLGGLQGADHPAKTWRAALPRTAHPGSEESNPSAEPASPAPPAWRGLPPDNGVRGGTSAACRYSSSGGGRGGPPK